MIKWYLVNHLSITTMRGHLWAEKPELALILYLYVYPVSGHIISLTCHSFKFSVRLTLKSIKMVWSDGTCIEKRGHSSSSSSSVTATAINKLIILSLLKGRLALRKTHTLTHTHTHTHQKKHLCSRFGGPWHKSVDGCGLHSGLG